MLSISIIDATRDHICNGKLVMVYLLVLVAAKNVKSFGSTAWKYLKVEAIPPFTGGFFHGPGGRKMENFVNNKFEGLMGKIAGRIREMDAEEERERLERALAIKIAIQKRKAEEKQKLEEAQKAAKAKAAEEAKKAKAAAAAKAAEEKAKAAEEAKKEKPKEKPKKQKKRKDKGGRKGAKGAKSRRKKPRR
ncbi:unnamed protein product [Chrysodeixis includens]|uniref:Uncharacterized protein n=1 Tax=Chrysodeixis includens TaxID=689277 RepID=A0A9N8KQ15_CHRIL|nr:unnamed protein product [Chrysodeixis includens]